MKGKNRRDGVGGRTMIVPLQAVDGLRSGTIKVDQTGEITYANAEFSQIAGITSQGRLNIRDLLPDEASYRIVANNLKKKWSEVVATRYEISLTRRDDGAKVPVEIIAFPETNQAGLTIGSVAIIRELTAEVTARAIKHSSETMRSRDRMFAAVAAAVKRVVPFNWFNVSLYSEDGMHVRELYSLADEPLPKWPVRWYKMTPLALRLVKAKRLLVIPDLNRWMAKPINAALRKDRATRTFLKLGYRSCLWCPVVQEGKTVAGITFYRKSRDSFTDRHKRLIKALPLGRPVSAALFQMRRQDLELRLDLIRGIAASSANVNRVAAFLVRKLKKHYQWDNVSIFRVDENGGRVVLLAESYKHPDFKFGKGFSQKIDEGVLGYVLKSRTSIRSGNVLRDPRLKGCFKEGLKGRVLSELTIPIMAGDKVCALFNSEDERENAYAQEEQTALESVLGEVAVLYHRIQLEQNLAAIQQSTRDAIIRTDPNGVILSVNPSATRLLGYPETELMQKSLGDFLADRSMAAYFLKADNVLNRQLTFAQPDGTTRDLLVSASPLPAELGGRVYIACDMSLPHRAEQLKNLQGLYHEIALQSQVPLSLCFSWLHRLLKRPDEPTGETLSRVIEQLKKAQLTFDRLSMFEREGSTFPFNPLQLDFWYILDEVLRELPAWEAALVARESSVGLPPIRGDFFQLAFCLKSVLAYLVRFLPPDSQIRLSAKLVNNRVRILIRGVAPECQPGVIVSESESCSQPWTDLALGKEILQQFLSNHKGSFEGPRRLGNEVNFQLTLPVAKSGAVR